MTLPYGLYLKPNSSRSTIVYGFIAEKRNNMNKSELIAVTAENTGLTRKDAERVLNAALDAITASLAEHEKVQLSGFGTFEVKYREARMGRNLQTKEPSRIPAAWVPAFKPSKALRDLIGKE